MALFRSHSSFLHMMLTRAFGIVLSALLLFGFGSSVGFSLALVLFAGIRERLDGADVPVNFKGTAIAMVTAGIMSLAFMGFAGLDKY